MSPGSSSRSTSYSRASAAASSWTRACSLIRYRVAPRRPRERRNPVSRLKPAMSTLSREGDLREHDQRDDEDGDGEAQDTLDWEANEDCHAHRDPGPSSDRPRPVAPKRDPAMACKSGEPQEW